MHASVQDEDITVPRGWRVRVLTSSQVFHSSGPPSSSLKCQPVCQSLAAEDKGAQHGGWGKLHGHGRANRGQEGCDVAGLSRNADQATPWNWSSWTQFWMGE